MFPDPRFKLTHQALLTLMISSAFSASASAEVARVNFAFGEVTATGKDGRSRTLAKGAEINVGETVNTENGRAQLAFTDGAHVSMQPKTQFRIDDFRYEGKADGSEKGFFSLLKGGLRTITGAIGRTNRNTYRVTTATATIGIRGTEFLASVENPLRVSVGDGSISLTNQRGTFVVEAGQSAYVADANTLPVITSEKPVLPPPGTSRQMRELFTDAPRSGRTDNATGAAGNSGDVVAGNRTDSGFAPIQSTPLISLFTPLQSGPGYGLAQADGSALRLGEDIFVTRNSVGVPVTATFDGSGRLTQFVQGTNTFTLIGSHAEFTTDGVLAWGRWIGDVNLNGSLFSTFSSNQGLHYVVGVPTAFASLPTGVTFTYNLIGATSPTFLNGGAAPGTLTSGTLTGNFSTNRVDVTFAGTAGGFTFNATVSNMPISNTGGAATFAGLGRYTGTLGTEDATASGFFAGSGATRAGMSYTLQATSVLNRSPVVGAAAFAR